MVVLFVLVVRMSMRFLGNVSLVFTVESGLQEEVTHNLAASV